MRELIKWLNERTVEYQSGHPTVSDKEWDEKYFKLEKLEEKTGIIYHDSPTQTVYYIERPLLEKVTHNHPLLSLDKTKDKSAIKDFCDQSKATAMLKMDGLTITLTYIDGWLTAAETRGNGYVGEDVLHNASKIANLPVKIPLEGKVIVDGEVICPIDVFEEKFSNEYKNARNFAAGSIRLLNSKESEQRNLKFIAWNYYLGSNSTYFPERLCELEDLGFEVVPWTNDIDNCFNELKETAKKKHYPIDGLVFRYTSIPYGVSLGETSHHPRHSLAFKFYDETAQSKLISIEYEVSRNGLLTPVVNFEPVELEGTTVSRASLFNISIMEELSGGWQRVGDILTIQKSNQIIPTVVEWEHEDSSPEQMRVNIPTKCPYCGKDLKFELSNSNIKTLYCSNPNCNCRLINQLDYFCGKNGLDIKGLSKSTLSKLIDWGWIKEKIDIFNLSSYRNEWIKKEGFGLKSVDNILKAIENSKETTLDHFITSLGIPLVGANIAKEIAKKEENYIRFRDDINSQYDFSLWEGFGPELNTSISNFNYEEADRIYQLLIIKNNLYGAQNNDSSLKDMIICITGTLEFGSRDNFKKFLESKGAKVTGTVSKKTNYLVANKEETSSKYKKALELNVPIITEKELMEKI